MRRNMTVGELKRYYKGLRPRQILFCTENQAWDKVESPLKASLAFTSMVIACNPNVICLKDGENTLWFEGVRRVIVDTGQSFLGTVLDVICGDCESLGNDVHYTLIVL